MKGYIPADQYVIKINLKLVDVIPMINGLNKLAERL